MTAWGDQPKRRAPLVQTTFLDPVKNAEARVYRARCGVRAAARALFDAVHEWRRAQAQLAQVQAVADDADA